MLFYFLVYKKVDVKGDLEKVKTGLEEIEGYLSAGEKLTTGKTKVALDITDKIAKLAITGVNAAEDLFLATQITDDKDGSKRRETALNYIYAALKDEGITVDDNVKTIAEGIVRSTVFSDKTLETINSKVDKLIDEKVLELQKTTSDLTSKNAEVNKIVENLKAEISKYTIEKVSLQSQISTLTNTNKALTDKINEVNSVVASTPVVAPATEAPKTEEVAK